MNNTVNNLALKIENQIKDIIKNDEYAQYTGIRNDGNYVENNSYFIPLFIRNNNANFDMFSFIVQLEAIDNNDIYVSAKYGNQNTYQTVDFGSLKDNEENTLIDKVSEEFTRKFNASKCDFEQLSR